MKNLIYLLGVISVMLLAACNRCHNADYYWSSEQASFSNIKSGSYWIMKDSLSGKRDSFVVGGIGEDATQKSTSKYCADTWHQRSIGIGRFDGSTGHWVDSITYIMYFGYTDYSVFEIRYQSSSIRIIMPLILTFNKQFIINGNVYSAASVGQDNDNSINKLYIDKDHLLLKLVVETPYEHHVWELERASIIR